MFDRSRIIPILSTGGNRSATNIRYLLTKAAPVKVIIILKPVVVT